MVNLPIVEVDTKRCAPPDGRFHPVYEKTLGFFGPVFPYAAIAGMAS
jgi:hypothetical protein